MLRAETYGLELAARSQLPLQINLDQVRQHHRQLRQNALLTLLLAVQEDHVVRAGAVKLLINKGFLR